MSLNSLMDNKHKVKVFFDSKCRICKVFKRLVQKLDNKEHIKFVDLWQEKQGQIDVKDLAKEIHLITQKGEIYKGYYAVKYILGNLSVFLPFRIFLNSIFMDRIGIVLYKFLARNRMKLNICNDKCG